MAEPESPSPWLARIERVRGRREAALLSLEAAREQAARVLREAQAELDARVAAGRMTLPEAVAELEELSRATARVVEDAHRRAGADAEADTGDRAGGREPS